MAEHNDFGKWGEDEAAHFLEQKGYVILEKGWKMGKRDLDVIALTEDHSTIVFVEVKSRENNAFQEPEEAVDVQKMRNLAIAANSYIKQNGISTDVRFDIISIVGKCSQLESISHIEDAFNPLLIL